MIRQVAPAGADINVCDPMGPKHLPGCLGTGDVTVVADLAVLVEITTDLCLGIHRQQQHRNK